MCPTWALGEVIRLSGGAANIPLINIGGTPLMERLIRQRLTEILRVRDYHLEDLLFTASDILGPHWLLDNRSL